MVFRFFLFPLYNQYLYPCEMEEINISIRNKHHMEFVITYIYTDTELRQAMNRYNAEAVH